MGEPDFEARFGRAREALQGTHLGEAAGICADLLEERPENPAVLALLGTVRSAQGDHEAGIFLTQSAIAHQGESPPAGWLSNLASMFRSVNKTEEAEAAIIHALQLSPEHQGALLNGALVFADTGNGEREAICLLRALGLNPDNAEAHLALAQHLLARGEMQAGWAEYEWRSKTAEGLKATLKGISSPKWNGMPIPNGKILLIGDQGYGDTIQFSRYVPMVRERCAEVVVGCSPEMLPLLRRIPGVSVCTHQWNMIPPHAAHAMFASLPGLFETRIDSIPAQVPYLSADPLLVASWKDRLRGDRMRVGLAWDGRPTHPNNSRRSIPLERLLLLSDVPGITWVAVQKTFPKRDVEVAARFPGLHDISADLHSWDSTAALIQNLDLLITVDSGPAHMAGALNVPAMVMLPRANDWRWFLERADSPWYPSIRLFRQPKPGDWDSVILQVRKALAEIGGG